MAHGQGSGIRAVPRGLIHGRRHRAVDRRSFLDMAGGIAAGALTAGAVFAMPWADDAGAQPVPAGLHQASARLLDRLRTSFSFQISVDVATVNQGLAVAGAALAGGVTIVEMGTPLLKNEGVANVVPAFRRQFPAALLLADLKTMDGGAFEARAVYAGGGNIVDFLALAGVATAKAICAVRDEFRHAGPELARLAFADILVPHQGPATQAVDVAVRMLEAGVDGVGVHLQADARRADPTLIEGQYLGDVARAVSRRPEASPGRGCVPSSSAATSASRTVAPATTCLRTRSNATSPGSSPGSRAPEGSSPVARRWDPGWSA
jgi:3-keto-L-gulonate-6-phosphate decarboxylase